MKYKVGYIVVFFGWLDIKVGDNKWQSLGFAEKTDFLGNIYTDIFREEDI